MAPRIQTRRSPRIHARRSPRIQSRRSPRTRHLGVAAAGLAAALTLAACSGSDDSPTTGTSSAATSAAATSAGSNGAALTGDPAARVPSTGFHTGFAEAWTIPGAPIQDTTGSVSADRSMIGMWAESVGGTLQVYELTPTATDPLWEGQCATANWWADHLVCGGDVVDPRTGDTTPRPAGIWAGGTAETLVLRDGETWVAYNTDLAESWQTDAVGDGMVYGFPDLPAAMAVDMTTFAFHTVDLRTGEATPTALTVLVADGYLEAMDAAGPVIAHDFTGAVLGERPIDAPECIAPYGERQVLADRLDCPDRYDGEVSVNGLDSFLLRTADSPKALELSATGFKVAGEEFLAGDRGFQMAWMFGDQDHFLARFDAGFGLYAIGSPDPVWELDANDLLVASPEILLAYRAGSTAAVLTPAP